MVVGKVSSRKVCHTIFGGLEIMLNIANLTTGARLNSSGTCTYQAISYGFPASGGKNGGQRIHSLCRMI